MSSKEAVLATIAGKKGLSEVETKRLDATLRRVAWVESKGKADAVQESGGPGRGKYQFEEGASTEALIQRVANYEKVYGEVPLTEADKKALTEGDMSKVSEDGQDALVLVDWVMKTPGDEVGDLARGIIPPKYFWAQFHWAGDMKDRHSKLEQWDREMYDYERMGYGVR